MNRAGPATPVSPPGGVLRALRHPPLLVDDLALEARLAAIAPTPPPDPFADDAEGVRWTRAWLVVWQGVLHSAGIIGTAAPWTVSVPLDDVPTLKGDPVGARRAGALARLEGAGLLVRTAGGSAARLDASLFAEHRAGLEVDWGGVCRACRYEPAALLVLRSLVEMVVPAEVDAPVSLRELAGRTGYAEKQVRIALRRLADSGVIVARDLPGQATRYRLSATALGRPSPAPDGGRPSAPRPAPVHDVDARAGLAPVPPVAPSPSGGPPAVRLSVNGVTLGVAAGLDVDVTLDADGLPRVTIRPPAG